MATAGAENPVENVSQNLSPNLGTEMNFENGPTSQAASCAIPSTSQERDRPLYSCNALHIAVNTANISLVRVLLPYCKDINSTCADGSALHITVRFGYMNIVRLLIEYGADIDLKFGKHSATP